MYVVLLVKHNANNTLATIHRYDTTLAKQIFYILIIF